MTRQQTVRPKLPIDILLFGATLALVVIGLWMVFDSSYVKTLDSERTSHDAFFFVKRQAFGAILGLGVLLTMMQFGYWRLRRFAFPLMIVGMLLLCAVWIPHLGVVENNAARWVKIGPLNFQPSELAKLTLILYLAALLSRPDCRVGHITQGLGPPLSVIAIYLFLIEREPDLGTAVVLFLVVMTMFFLAGARKRHIVLISTAALIAVLLLGFGFGHRQGRIMSYLHPEKYRDGIGYQIYHARLAVGSGQVLGEGLGQGREKYYLPQGNSDFIFATMAEELGFVGCVPMLTLFFLIGARGFSIARQTRDRFGQLLAAGIAALISCQALINVAVVTGSIPATGVPLPFISLGSSSLILSLAGIGILLNIAQHPTPPSQVETGKEERA
jgi:cell division protein FtsW